MIINKIKFGKTVKNSSSGKGENSVDNHVGVRNDDAPASYSTSDGSMDSMDFSASMIWELPRINSDASSMDAPLKYGSTSSCASGSLDSNIRNYGPIDVDTCRKHEKNAKKAADSSTRIARSSSWKNIFHTRDCSIPKVVSFGSKERTGKEQSHSEITETNVCVDCEHKLETMVFV